MTVLQMVQNVYEALGEPSDIQYLDDADNVLTTSVGWRRMIDAINTACLEISVWKFPDGRTIRFRYLEDSAQLVTKYESATIVSAVTNMPFITTTLTDVSVNAYQNCAIQLGSSTYRVRYSRVNPIVPTQVDLMLNANVTVLANATFNLSKREYYFQAQTIDPFTIVPTNIAYTAINGAPLEITNVYDMSSNSELSLLKKYDPLIASQVNFQTPTMFYKLAGGLRFDTYPTSTLNYTIRYMRGPRILSYDDINAEPELPVQFHGAINLHALWWGYRRMQENDSAYSTKQDLTDMLRRLRTEYDLQGELTSHQFTINMGV